MGSWGALPGRSFHLVSLPSPGPPLTHFTLGQPVALRWPGAESTRGWESQGPGQNGEGERVGNRPLRGSLMAGRWGAGGVSFWPHLPANESVTFSPKAEL